MPGLARVANRDLPGASDADRARLDALLFRLQNDLFNLGSDLATLPAEETTEAEDELEPADAGDTPLRITIVGRPNVGKSSIANKLAGEDRVVVADSPGTTRDAVDIELVREVVVQRGVADATGGAGPTGAVGSGRTPTGGVAETASAARTVVSSAAWMRGQKGGGPQCAGRSARRDRVRCRRGSTPSRTHRSGP